MSMLIGVDTRRVLGEDPRTARGKRSYLRGNQQPGLTETKRKKSIMYQGPIPTT